MAPPAGQIRPGRYLWVFAVIVVGLYALVFGTGDHHATPKLGIDLKGGTTVTLTARTPNGQPPTSQQLDQAQQIIETRVNGLGVSGAQVVLQGNNIIITVPGNQGNEAKNLGQTAKLVFRPVLQQAANTVTPPATSTAPASGSVPPTTGSAPPTSGSASAGNPPSSASSAPPSSPPANGLGAANVYQAPGSASTYQQTGPQAYVAANPTTTPPPSTPTSTAPSAPATAPAAGNPNNETTQQQQAAAIAAAKATRQTADTTQQAANFAAYTCQPGSADPLIGNDDPKLPLITCDQAGDTKYLLGPSFLDGTQISDASASLDPNGVGYVVNLTFKSAGASTWANYTAANVNKQAAFVLDTEVVSAPTIQEAISGGNTQISGNFTQQQATDLANTLKYGSLPLAFDASDAQTISATLGLASLKWGLTAGAIGLLLVFIYCLFYYRALGVLTILSLVLSGLTIYAVLVLLGRWIDLSLDLAGIAGFIIAIGITADSFVVFFERLKDEVREGRTFRSAVPRAWIRARRTILASDAVSFLAAVVLYIFAVQDVQGFAFTLGLSTVLDLLIVFLVTHPLVVLASRSKMMSKPGVSGLGAVQKAGVEMRAARPSTGRPGVKGA
ncbi:MAG TPA: protein translocase subunit SecD [Pseudonocardiaceae bacterium]|nr:protein translocase subunit SecD [Pseudonocardiaceae bacterium]